MVTRLWFLRICVRKLEMVRQGNHPAHHFGGYAVSGFGISNQEENILEPILKSAHQFDQSQYWYHCSRLVFLHDNKT